MASARFAWGIDVGNRALKAVKLVRDGDGLRVDDFDIIEHEHVLSNAGDNKDSLIQTALANFVQRHPMKNGVAAIGVAGQSSFARFIKLPPVEPKRIPEIVKFEAIQQIPFPLDEVEWSYQLFQPAESPEVEVGIFAMRKDLIARHMKFFTDVDMNVQLVQMNPLAVYNAMYYDQRLKGTTMVIDLGAENTDLIICDNDTVWMRSIPIGGNNFTETLVKAFKLPFGKAEDLKRNAATSKYARQIFQAMRPVFADLVAEIQRSVGFYASVHRDSRIKKIIALGGTFRLPGLQKYLQQNMSLDVERLDTIAAGTPSDSKVAAIFNENVLSSISAYGLAVQAMGEGKITSSLLPSAIRRERLWKQKIPIFGAAAAAFVVGTGIAAGGYFIQNKEYVDAANYRSQITTVQNEAKALDTEWSQVANGGADERALITNLQGLGKYRDLWRNMIRDIENAVPAPQPDVAKGLLLQDPELVKSIPRNEREQIVIHDIQAEYRRDVDTLSKIFNDNAKLSQFKGKKGVVVAAAGEGDQPDANPDAANPGAASAQGAAGQTRGVLFTIRCTSPYNVVGADSALTKVMPKFIENLMKIKPSASMPAPEYQVIKAGIGNTGFVKDGTLGAELQSNFDKITNSSRGKPQLQLAKPTGARGAPGAAGAKPAAPVVTDVNALLDRLTAENLGNDWDVTLVVLVQLDPPPYQPPAPTASNQ